jgi:hypothetical protein
MTWRKSWARNWDAMTTCSEGCRKRRADLHTAGQALEDAILALLDGRTGTICPSEAARAVSPDGWRDLMEPAREAARRLVAAGLCVITQGGHIVDPSTAKGPIRIRRVV